MTIASEPAPRTLIYRPESYVERLTLGRMFARAQPLEVELGCGDGGFMLKWAGLRPDRNFIAVERLLGRLRKLDRKGARAGLENLRLLRIEAAYFVRYLLPRESVSAFHLYFPDPWPKRKHRKHRLVQGQFVESIKDALVPRGEFYVRTDDTAYYEQIREVMAGYPAFELSSTPEDLRAVTTDFEQEFGAKGIQPFHAAWRRRA